MTSLPPFDGAIQQLKALLAEHAASAGIVWIFREDLACWRRRFYVKTPLPEENPVLVRSLYESDPARNFGVQLSTACRMGERVCCYIWRPATPEEAELSWVSGLKLSVPSDLQAARKVKREFIWTALLGLQKLSRLPQPFSGLIISRQDVTFHLGTKRAAGA